MSSEADTIIAIGHDLTSIKYYAFATCTILFYDYFLTLADEVKYAWSGKKSWTFWLFIAVPPDIISVLAAGTIWSIIHSRLLNKCKPHHSKAAYILIGNGGMVLTVFQICDKTAFFSPLAFVTCTLLAQVVLTIRIYAVTMKNVPIVVGFAIITAGQLAVGICLVTYAARSNSQPLPAIPFDAYRGCIYTRNRKLEMACVGIPLVYDFLVFLVIIFTAVRIRSKATKRKIPSILETIAQDAMWYFMVIFTSHFVLEMTLSLGRDSIQLLPATGNVVYLSVMISRLMLSLKKAAASQQGGWSLAESSTNDNNFQSIKFFHTRKGTNGKEDDTALDTYPGS